MANTVIQLKWSEASAVPTSLNVAEPAYSNTSGKLFIGQAGNQVIAVGGRYYTELLENAASANTANTIVKRDTAGIFSATAIYASLYGNANTASTWATARTIGVSGDANGTVSIDGSANANIPLTLGSTGVSAGTYGGITQIPTFSVDAKGRITSAANVSISTTLNIAGDAGTDAVALATDTVTFKGGDGITTAVTAANSTVIIDVDNTVVRTTGGTISGDLSVTGNLTITGTTTTVNTSTVTTTDSLIKLASNNTVGDVLDIGFYGQANTGSSVTYHGLVRQAAGNFFLFKGLVTDPTSNTLATGSLTAANTATLRANITGGTVSSLASAIAVADGGTGAGTFTGGAILIGNGTGALQTLANSTYTQTGVFNTAKTITSLTVDSYGRVTAASSGDISIGAGQIASGTLPIASGGTNQTSYTAGQRLVYDGTSLSSQANTGYTLTGGVAAANTITSLTVNSYGEVSAVTAGAIAIAASQVTSGTLAVARGGTGLASYTTGDIVYASGATTLASLADVATGNALISGGIGVAPSYGKIGLTTHISGTLAVGNGGTGNTALTLNGVVLGQGASALTTVVSATEGHVLQISSAGVPTFAHLNGGSF
jgi:hypothetical protein